MREEELDNSLKNFAANGSRDTGGSQKEVVKIVVL